MKCIIAAPDKKTRTAVEKVLEESGEFKLIKTCTTAEAAMEAALKNPIDVIFVDMLMPGMDHMGFLSELPYPRPSIIVMADKKEAAVEAFEFAATDFILKPVSSVRLLKAVARVLKNDAKAPGKKQENGTHLFLRLDGRMERVDMKDITYIEGESDYVKVFTATTQHRILSTLKGILRHLPAKDFMRVHKSYIVRLDKIESIEDDMARVGKKMLSIAPTYKAELLNRLKIYPEMPAKNMVEENIE